MTAAPAPERRSARRASQGAARATKSSLWLAALALSAALGCGPGSTAAQPAGAPSPAAPIAPEELGPPVEFAWPSIRGGEATSEAMRGRTTLLVFGTTYDVASQAQVRFVTAVVRRHTPRINALLVVLEQPENRILVEAFASAFDLPYPVALADAATIAGEGPFRGLHHVPSVVVLDALGRERARHLGLLDEAGLDELLSKVDAAP